MSAVVTQKSGLTRDTISLHKYVMSNLEISPLVTCSLCVSVVGVLPSDSLSTTVVYTLMYVHSLWEISVCGYQLTISQD